MTTPVILLLLVLFRRGFSGFLGSSLGRFWMLFESLGLRVKKAGDKIHQSSWTEAETLPWNLQDHGRLLEPVPGKQVRIQNLGRKRPVHPVKTQNVNSTAAGLRYSENINFQTVTYLRTLTARTVQRQYGTV